MGIALLAVACSGGGIGPSVAQESPPEVAPVLEPVEPEPEPVEPEPEPAEPPAGGSAGSAPPVTPPTPQQVLPSPVGGPTLPAGSTWEKVWGDEFDGDMLDRDRWGFKPRAWGIEHPERNVSVSGGHLVLANTRHEETPGDVKYHTAAIWSRPEPGSSRDTAAGVGFESVYGYFEARIQVPPTRAGLHAAFWLQSYYKNPDGSYAGIEVDILEAPSLGDEYQVATHKRPPAGSRISWEQDIPLAGVHDGFHVFAVHLQPDRYDFYANGKQVATYDGPHISSVPQFIYLTTGFHWEWDLVDRPELFPNDARVDWVRVWKVAGTD